MKYAALSGLIRRQFQDVEREYNFVCEIMNEMKGRQDDRFLSVLR